ncbi:universal stress protein [Kitasatospora sp. NPDC092286]|uniref:universal stress protein n=1 Tax=Kitasatospora sp. NPDC092286 TaxID=3364087 RepID=UPI0037FDE6A3
MTTPIVAGFDGSPESVAAAGWAGREALLRALPLELLQAWPWPKTDVLGTSDAVTWSRQQLAAEEARLRALLTGVEVTSAHVPHDPADALEAAGRRAAMLVLGSRGLGALRGFLVGSVSQEVLRRAPCPVVLVRAAEEDSATDAGNHEVVVGLDLRRPFDEVLAFAFEAAELRSAPLRAVHAWDPPTGSAYMAFAAIGSVYEELSAVEKQQLTDVLAPWRARHPRVAVTADLVRGNASVALVEATAAAGLAVVGRRARRAPIGTRLGSVAHAAIHHVRCPVAVVPYG